MCFVFVWVVQLGERIHELEDELESRLATIQELEGELNASDAAFEENQLVHDQVVASLKEVSPCSSRSSTSSGNPNSRAPLFYVRLLRNSPKPNSTSKNLPNSTTLPSETRSFTNSRSGTSLGRLSSSTRLFVQLRLRRRGLSRRGRSSRIDLGGRRTRGRGIGRVGRGRRTTMRLTGVDCCRIRRL